MRAEPMKTWNVGAIEFLESHSIPPTRANTSAVSRKRGFWVETDPSTADPRHDWQRIGLQRAAQDTLEEGITALQIEIRELEGF